MRINIVDAGCGIGKTTALINKINNDVSDQKYIFVTPFLSEVDRIIKSCQNKNFIDPRNENGKSSKYKNIMKLFEEEKNIVTTHSLFQKFNNEIIKIIKEKNYILIMDEVVDLVYELPISKPDLKLLIDNYIYLNPRTHILEWTDNEYNGKLEEYKKMIQMNSVFAHTNKDDKITALIWMFPYKIFECFKQVYILTYMFDGQIQKKYFDYFNTEYAMLYVKDFQLTYTPQTYDYAEQKKLIKVCDIERLNLVGWDKISLSKRWFELNKNNSKVIQLQNNVRSFFRSFSNTNNKKILWTTFKEYKRIAKGKGFSKGFAPMNCRATNSLSDKNAIAYIANRFFNPIIKNFFIFNNIPIGQEFEDRFALSELIQFVYRSSIRNNKPITVYIPSKRMRDLFLEWLKKPND